VYGDRENPTSSKCLGVFGLNFTTTETDLDREFRRYGKIEKVQVVLDGPTKRSRGFAFIYFEQMEDAEKARDAMNGTEISGFKIRVDFSITNAAHRPTPGVYFHHGKATRPGFRLRDSRRGGRGDYRDRHHERDHRHHEERDRYHDRRPPPSYYDRGYDRYDYGPPRHREERYYDYHRDHRDKERERYYEDRYRDDRDRYREERYREERYDRPPRDYYERDRYERYDRPPSHHYSGSARRSGSPSGHHSRRAAEY